MVMRLGERVEADQLRYLGAATAIGGLLWIPYGVFEMLQPWGIDTIYRDDRGYEVVTDAPLYWLYSLPGSLALLFTALGLRGVFTLLGLRSRFGRLLTYAALALATLSLIGLIIMFDPLFTAPRIFGTLALGTATLLAGIEARRNGVNGDWEGVFLFLGLLGIFLLPLWPLVFAIEILPEGGGAAIIALFGLGWFLLGYRLWSSLHARDGSSSR
jgi:hypothetical protein